MTDAPLAPERFRLLLDDARPPTGGAGLAPIEAEVASVLPLLTEIPAESPEELVEIYKKVYFKKVKKPFQ